MGSKCSFFYYGTLMEYPPFDWAAVLSRRATVKGRLTLFNNYYPAALIEEEGTIRGAVVDYDFDHDDDLGCMLRDMDQWEGCRNNDPKESSYFRIEVDATIEETGEVVKCSMYVLNPHGPFKKTHIDLSVTIPDGDWHSWRRRKNYG